MSQQGWREAVFEPGFLDDLEHWTRTNQKLALRTIELINLTLGNPFRGSGKPKHLGKSLGGAWSRRITDKHRLVYNVTGNQVRFLSARFHYRRNLRISFPSQVHQGLPQIGDGAKEHRRDDQSPIPRVASGSDSDCIDSAWALDGDWRALLDNVWRENGD